MKLEKICQKAIEIKGITPDEKKIYFCSINITKKCISFEIKENIPFALQKMKKCTASHRHHHLSMKY